MDGFGQIQPCDWPWLCFAVLTFVCFRQQSWFWAPFFVHKFSFFFYPTPQQLSVSTRRPTTPYGRVECCSPSSSSCEGAGALRSEKIGEISIIFKDLSIQSFLVGYLIPPESFSSCGLFGPFSSLPSAKALQSSHQMTTSVGGGVIFGSSKKGVAASVVKQ